MFVKDFKELKIYQLALRLAQEVSQVVYQIPFHWNIKEVSQVVRSSSSVPSNITEGFGNRFYTKKFIHYLNIALGSSDETQNHLELLYRKGHFTFEKSDYYIKEYKNLSIRILNFINYLLRRPQDGPQ